MGDEGQSLGSTAQVLLKETAVVGIDKMLSAFRDAGEVWVRGH